MPSQETLDEPGASQEAGARIEEEFEASQEEASSTEGIDVERIMNWLWSVRTRLREGAASLGAQIAEAFYGFIEQSDFQLGRSLGNVTGQILFEIILGIITAGGWTALSVAKPLIKVGAKIAKMLKRTIHPLIRLIKRLRGPVSRGLTAIGDVLRQIPGMRGIIDRIEDAMRRMMRYVDEFEAPPRQRDGTPDATPDRRGARDGDDARRRHDDDDDDDDDKRRRLRRAVRDIEPEIRRMLRDGAGETRLNLRLAQLRTRHRLSFLGIIGGRLVARVNPSDVVMRLRELGDDLDEILSEVEDVFLSGLLDDDDTLDRVDREQQRREAEAARNRGEEVDFPADGEPIPLTMNEEVVVRRTQLVEQSPGRVALGDQIAESYIGSSLAQTFILNAGNYEDIPEQVLKDLRYHYGIRKSASNYDELMNAAIRDYTERVTALRPMPEADLELPEQRMSRTRERRRGEFARNIRRRQILSAGHEAARADGSLVGQRLSHAMARSGAFDESPLETVLGRSEHAPMNHGGRSSTTDEASMAARRRDIHRLFEDLADAAEDADFFMTPDGQSLASLRRAVRAWALARVPSDGDVGPSQRTRLSAELRIFLETRD